MNTKIESGAGSHVPICSINEKPQGSAALQYLAPESAVPANERRRSKVFLFRNPPHVGSYVVRSLLRRSIGVLALAAILIASFAGANAKEIKLLNVSYDPTREFYQEFNAAFSKYWEG